jgi:hypothetical protein
MLIRSTPAACFVLLPNGLTLELFYADALTKRRDGEPKQPTPASQGVWLMGQSVLFSIRAGQA